MGMTLDIPGAMGRRDQGHHRVLIRRRQEGQSQRWKRLCYWL